jgi:beta-glucanase (GH16 family)
MVALALGAGVVTAAQQPALAEGLSPLSALSATLLGPATICASPLEVCVGIGGGQESPTPDPASPTSAPSGAPMPSGDISGWAQVFADDFPGAAVDGKKWGVYSGQPGSDPGTQWSPSHVRVQDGLLTIDTYQDPAYGGMWTSGGINNARSAALSEGKYEIRMRADKASGVNVVGLLWPKNNVWPPEIDFVEDRDGDRVDFEATLHYRDASGKHSMVHRRQVVDMSEWHTYGVEWGAGRIVYTIDGVAWATVDHPFVPDVPMGMAVQSNAVTKGAVKAGDQTPAMSSVQLDWVVAYVPR